VERFDVKCKEDALWWGMRSSLICAARLSSTLVIYLILKVIITIYMSRDCQAESGARLNR
jgi:hypothetical protein